MSEPLSPAARAELLRTARTYRLDDHGCAALLDALSGQPDPEASRRIEAARRRAARAAATPEQRSAEAARLRATKARKQARKGGESGNTPPSLVSQQPHTKTAGASSSNAHSGPTNDAERSLV